MTKPRQKLQISHSDIICALGYCLEAKNAQCPALIFTSLELGVLLNYSLCML